MTDKKSDTSNDDRARPQAPVLTTPPGKRVPPADTPAPNASKPNKGAAAVLAPAALVLALVAVGVSGTLWQQSRQSQDSYNRLSAQLAGNESAAERTASQIQEVLARVKQQDTQIAALQAELGEASNVIRDLDEALRSMTDRGSELVLLNDVDHLVTIAQQQLQLGGNVRNAIVALESAQAQLARANKPAMASLLQTLNGDLDRLRAASTIDVGAISQQLEELAILLTEAPLIIPEKGGRLGRETEQHDAREHPAPTVPAPVAQEGQWWEQAWDSTRQWSRDAWGSLREDLGQFIEVRRVDDASAMLMSPDQAARFRDNLRTRVMTAQLALMMRQPEIWETETAAVVKALESRYDEASPLTRKALRMARSMADASIDARLPTVDNTLHALVALREEQSRNFGTQDIPAAPAGQPAGSASEETPSESPASSANDAESASAQENTGSELQADAPSVSEPAPSSNADGAEESPDSAPEPAEAAGDGAEAGQLLES